MKYTENYSFNQPQEGDNAQPFPFNGNWYEVDRILKEHEDAIKNVKVTTDTTVTEGGTNPVSGGAVKKYVDDEISGVEKSVEEISSTFNKSANIYNEKTNTVEIVINSNGVETANAQFLTTDFIQILKRGNYYERYDPAQAGRNRSEGPEQAQL